MSTRSTRKTCTIDDDRQLKHCDRSGTLAPIESQSARTSKAPTVTETIAPLEGLLILDKPAEITSFDCIRHLKKLLPKKTKIGHAGTLDPFATGVMVIGIGRNVTKLLGQFLDQSKTYTARVKLGELTNTLDKTGIFIEKQDVPEISREQLEHVLQEFLGTHTQTPPAFSALKYQGKPLYKHARNGSLSKTDLEQILETKKREITIHEIHLNSFEPPFFEFTCHVSKGTYVRALALSIAQNVGTVGTTYELRRNRSGDFSETQAHTLESITSLEILTKTLVSPI